MESNAIEIRGLCKRYKGFSLDDLNLDLPYGCVLGLVGENGAGKSTTIRLIMDALERRNGLRAGGGQQKQRISGTEGGRRRGAGRDLRAGGHQCQAAGKDHGGHLQALGPGRL